MRARNWDAERQTEDERPEAGERERERERERTPPPFSALGVSLGVGLLLAAAAANRYSRKVRHSFQKATTWLNYEIATIQLRA